MPTYQYRCEKCGEVFEQFEHVEHVTDHPHCPKCGSERIEQVLPPFFAKTSRKR